MATERLPSSREADSTEEALPARCAGVPPTISKSLGVEVETFVSDYEGAILEFIHGSADRVDGYLVKPAGMTSPGSPYRTPRSDPTGPASRCTSQTSKPPRTLRAAHGFESLSTVLRWHKAKPFAQVNGLPVLLLPITVVRRGLGDH
jgi:hypothetical protein